MADPTAAKTRKELNQNHKEEGRNCSYDKTQDLCGVMLGEVKLCEAYYTVAWETLVFLSNILCQISWKGPFEAFWKMRKTFATNVFLRIS